MSPAVGLAAATQPWVWGIADGVALTLVLLNVALLVGVHARRIRQFVRSGREKRFHAQFEQVLAELDRTAARDPHWLSAHVAKFNELERPIAATMLIERMKPASEEERAHTLAVLREAGWLDQIVRGTRRRMPWRRALAIRTLGWLGADETVPVLIERLSDRNRYVRESAVRALGRIGDPRTLPQLEKLFRSPGRVGSGVVYDALDAFGRDAEPVFAGGLRSELTSVRVASCFGIAAVSDPDRARPWLAPLLDDEAAPVRSAAAESLGDVGGEQIPEGLARAVRDEQATVRGAATSALGAYDDRRAVSLAVDALLDPDRDVAVRAAEALVRLSRRSVAGPAAANALRTSQAWPVERALTFESLGVV
jgi:HEAT repeat protein